jgi:hypothetical protein
MVIHPHLTHELLAARERDARLATERGLLAEEARRARTEIKEPAREPLRPLPQPQPATRGC